VFFFAPRGSHGIYAVSTMAIKYFNWMVFACAVYTIAIRLRAGRHAARPRAELRSAA
jgi:hypothetical protein